MDTKSHQKFDIFLKRQDYRESLKRILSLKLFEIIEIIHKSNISKLRNEDQIFMHFCPCSMPAMVLSIPTTGNWMNGVRRESDITRLNSSDSNLKQLEFIASFMANRDI